MAMNPEGFQFQTLSTHFKDKQKKPKSTPSSQRNPSSTNGSTKNLNSNPKTKEEQDAENDIGSYANLIYGTIKNFFSGIIEIKGKTFNVRNQDHF